jgi:putative SOS response-associated peptidase YedK
MGMPIRFPAGVPNAQPRDVRITERAPILQSASEADAEALTKQGRPVELVERRWSWPAPSGKPVLNFRGEGRRFAPAERCVALADGFYEYIAPDVSKQGEGPSRRPRTAGASPGPGTTGSA